MSQSIKNRFSKRAVNIVERDLKDPEERELVLQILNNYHLRGLVDITTSDYVVSDEVVAVTELVVLTNCLRALYEKRKLESEHYD